MSRADPAPGPDPGTRTDPAPGPDQGARAAGSEPLQDAVVVGGGPGGLSAALWLGRFGRRVVVLDNDAPRNETTWAVHGFPGVPDPPPHVLRRALRDQAAAVGAVLVAGEVMEVAGEKDAFRVVLADGSGLRALRVILAYGLRDRVPAVAGLGDFYGTSVFHCPDCDGPTTLGEKVAVLGWDREAANLALYLLHWAAAVTVLTDGNHLPERERSVLAAEGVRIIDAAVCRAVGSGGRLIRMEMDGAEAVPVDYLFFHLGSEPCAPVAESLGCATADDGLQVDRGQETSVPGVYAVGDITGAPYLASIAAAEGVRAALSCHRSLLPPGRIIQ